jgi:hypothetical protein
MNSVEFEKMCSASKIGFYFFMSLGIYWFILAILLCFEPKNCDKNKSRKEQHLKESSLKETEEETTTEYVGSEQTNTAMSTMGSTVQEDDTISEIDSNSNYGSITEELCEDPDEGPEPHKKDQ